MFDDFSEIDFEYIEDVMLQGMDSKQIEEHLIMLIYRLNRRGYSFEEISEMMRGARR